MRKKHAYILLLFFLSMYSCADHKSKKKFLFAKPIPACENQHLYLEGYNISEGGVSGGEITSNYLTDSLNFRLFVGIHDEHETFIYHCNNDSITIKKIEFGSKNCRWIMLKDSSKTIQCDTVIIENKTFMLSDLTHKGKFE